MKKKLILLALCCAVLFTGCNSAARSLGGNMEVDLPDNKKLVNCTWKEDSFWYLTREMKPEETAETYEFGSKTNFGVLEGKVIIREHKQKQK